MGIAIRRVPSIPVPPPGTPQSRPVGILAAAFARSWRKKDFPPKAILISEDPRPAGDFYDFATNRPRHQCVGAGTLERFPENLGDKGRTSPDHIRFLTYTTRYNQDYWVTVSGLEKHYERAEVDAERLAGGADYKITTKNIARLDLRETTRAAKLRIDGQDLTLNAKPQITLEKLSGSWKVTSGAWVGLHKKHALQGPIDDAFLEPFLAVRPTGKPWNDAANKKALANFEYFLRAYASRFRAFIRVTDDKNVTAEDFAKYNVALFGDPGSNRWIAKIAGKLPVKWTKESITLGTQRYSSADHIPVLVYPNPLNPAHYVVFNSGYTFEEREYTGDYAMPRYGDYAVLKLGQEPGSDVAESGFFDESWKLARKDSTK